MSMTPMQFGPSSAIPNSAAIAATSTCMRAAGAPPSMTPPPGMITAGTPSAAASRIASVARAGPTASDRDVGHLRHGGEIRVARRAADGLVFGVDEVAARRRPDPVDVVAEDPRGVVAGRRADERNRSWREERPEVDRSRGLARSRRGRRWLRDRHGHPTTRSTPRRSSERAMIRRWISLVPSQMRSTRSSRR